MALDKRQTSAWMKGVIILISIMLVVGIGLPFLGSMGGNTGADTGDAGSGTLDSIAAQYQQTISGLQGALASDPDSGTVLLQAAYTHYDYALAVQQASAQDQTLVGMDVPLWLAAADYYQRAYEAGQTGPEVTTELAVAYHYSGQTPRAIARIEQTLAESPDFATAWFNAGIFYQAVGAVDDALGAFERYLALDPQGTAGDPDYAQQQITQLEQAGATVPGDVTPVEPGTATPDATPVDPSAETTP